MFLQPPSQKICCHPAFVRNGCEEKASLFVVFHNNDDDGGGGSGNNDDTNKKSYSF